jgi:hypothetical protein
MVSRVFFVFVECTSLASIQIAILRGFIGFQDQEAFPVRALYAVSACVPLSSVQAGGTAHTILERTTMAKIKDKTFEVACPDCGAMLTIDAATGVVVSHTAALRKRMFEDLETAAQAMREQEDRKESLFRQSLEAEKNKEDLFDKKFAEALRKAKGAPEGKPLREFDLD